MRMCACVPMSGCWKLPNAFIKNLWVVVVMQMWRIQPVVHYWQEWAPLVVTLNGMATQNFYVSATIVFCCLTCMHKGGYVGQRD